jgi:hypothetical protein
VATPLWDGVRWDEAVWPEIILERLGIEDLGIELYGFGQAVAAWDSATWGGYVWPARQWHAIACDVAGLRYAWGADRSLGVLTVAAGGAMELRTIDPDGTLDPSNGSSPYALDLMPGAYVRVTYQGTPIAIAVLDTITYSNATGEGSIGGTDAVGVVANIKVLVPVNPPTTLRALARSLVALAGLTYVRVEPDPPGGDPAVGVPNEDATGEVGLWSAISDAAIDALHYAWVGPDLLIHFRSHGMPADEGLTIGLSGVPLLELVAQSSADGIVNRVKARGTTGTTYTKEDPDSIRRFGAQIVDRTTRRVPDPVTWADYVVRDRAWASLEYLPSAIIPTTPAQLRSLVLMGGMELVRVRTDLTDPPVSVDMRSIGLQVEVSPDGWALAVLGYVSSVEWSDNMTPPPPTATVPNVLGQLLADATTAISAAGLTSSSTERESASTPSSVLEQTPAPAAVVSPGSMVSLVVAKAAVPVTATVPAIVGSLEADATAAILAAGLVAGTRTTAASAYAAGTVSAQAPAAGSVVAIGSAVAYTVSTGPVRVTRTTTSTKVARVALTDTGAKYGTGAELYSPAGAYQGWQNRVLIGLTADFSGALSVVKAVLRLRTSTQDNIEFGSNPKVRVQRLTASWSEGTATTPSSGNSVVYPGPAASSSGEASAAITRTEDRTVDIDITAIVRAWAPPAAGNSGSPNYGVRIIGYTETSATYTTEFCTDDHATTGARPQLLLTLDTI